MGQMSTPNQGSRVLPLSTKVTAAEKELVERVAEAEGVNPSELIRRRLLPWARKRDACRKEAA